jgi:RNA polymerase-binding transcription factor DksA
LLHEVIAYHNESQRTYLTAADIEQAVERVLERGEAHFKYIWAESSDPEQKTMRLLAEALVGKIEINAMDLQVFCESCGVTITPEHLAAVNSLASRDIVTRNGRLYRFTVPLIERWVRRTYPLMA